MQGNKSIIAHFPTSNAAHQAATLLQSAGLGLARIDQVAYSDENKVSTTPAAILPMAYSYNIGNKLTDAERLINITNPSASDYINSDCESMLTLVTREDQLQKAFEIIKDNGGTIVEIT